MTKTFSFQQKKQVGGHINSFSMCPCQEASEMPTIYMLKSEKWKMSIKYVISFISYYQMSWV